MTMVGTFAQTISCRVDLGQDNFSPTTRAVQLKLSCTPRAILAHPASALRTNSGLRPGTPSESFSPALRATRRSGFPSDAAAAWPTMVGPPSSMTADNLPT